MLKIVVVLRREGNMDIRACIILGVGALAMTPAIGAPRGTVIDGLATVQPNGAILVQYSPDLDAARRVENRLSLSYSKRRALQRDLSTLGYSPGSADGVLGRRSRQAIARWQNDRGYDVTGYITGNQLYEIGRLADEERERLARDDRAQERERAQQDKAFWQSTGALGSTWGLNRYLERYPNGAYARDARRQLSAQEENARRDQQAAQERDDRAYWRATGSAGSVSGLNDYLRRYPKGIYAADARRQLAAQRDAEDRAYWQRTGARGDADGLRRYLREYPDGVYAGTARRQLEEVERASRDGADWVRAERSDTIAGYREYLRRNPNGAYVSIAERRLSDLEYQTRTAREDAAWRDADRIHTLQGYRTFLRHYPNSRYASTARARLGDLAAATPLPDHTNAQIERARQYEESLLGPNPSLSMQMEQGLRKLGYQPGPIDGVIDEQTRDAIRALQRKLGRTVTGYVDADTYQILRSEMR